MKLYLLTCLSILTLSSANGQTTENPIERSSGVNRADVNITLSAAEMEPGIVLNDIPEVELAKNELGISLSSAAPDNPVINERIYKLNWKVDVPITAAGMAWSFFAFSKIYDKDPSTPAQMQALDKKNLWGVDRWAAGMHNEELDRTSNYLFYGSLVFPAFLFIDKDIRKDAAKISLLYLETFAVTGLLYTGSAYFINRYRPESYPNDIPQADKTSGNYKNAFFAGHPALVATASFFAAKVYADYHPNSKGKYYVYGGAAVATLGMVYMRHKAGKHFPTDLLVGTLIGITVPHAVLHFHKDRANKDRAWNLSPDMDFLNKGYGLTFNYRFK